MPHIIFIRKRKVSEYTLFSSSMKRLIVVFSYSSKIVGIGTEKNKLINIEDMRFKNDSIHNLKKYKNIIQKEYDKLDMFNKKQIYENIIFNTNHNVVYDFLYEFEWHLPCKMSGYQYELEDEKIEFDIEGKPYEIGEKIYLSKNENFYKILDMCRDEHDNWIYEVEHYYDVIEKLTEYEKRQLDDIILKNREEYENINFINELLVEDFCSKIKNIVFQQ